MGDISLFAGDDPTGYGSKFAMLHLDFPNDSFIPVASVYCRPFGVQYDSPNKESLLKTVLGASRFEFLNYFNHDNFGKGGFRLTDSANQQLYTNFALGFSDWTVETEDESVPSGNKDPFTGETVPNNYIKTKDGSGMASSRVKVDYNLWTPNSNGDKRDARDIDRIVLVIYHRDASGKWYISDQSIVRDGKAGENGALPDGTLNQNKVIRIRGNSKFTQKNQPLMLTANVNYNGTSQGANLLDLIVSVIVELGPNDTTAPLNPDHCRFKAAPATNN